MRPAQTRGHGSRDASAETYRASQREKGEWGGDSKATTRPGGASSSLCA